MRRWSNRGFTLIELMIVVGIVAILASVAFPGYKQHVVKGNRRAAQAQMMEIANREQQYLLANRSFASKTALEGTGYGLPAEVSRWYTYDIATATNPPAYTITFTATTSQSSDGDLSLNSEGGKACSICSAVSDKW
ncbi:type IV pilin protein [Ramlibacter sp.]|uniref:type IV pilin protein n=1 Tax=Ramlibacter sp. TaxID=1917967 RepID=UPI0017E1F8AE|nr:type IV pilin protein [Ramlibacter sp.]MBA2674040.1 prepilin-type N-terminal cleavage/methylation domain-containing protein [Ramlibacter sp.]